MVFTWASFPNGPMLTQSSLSPLVIMLCFPIPSTTDKSNYVKHVWEIPLGPGFPMMGRFSESKNKLWFSRDFPSMCSMTKYFPFYISTNWWANIWWIMLLFFYPTHDGLWLSKANHLAYLYPSWPCKCYILYSRLCTYGILYFEKS